MKAQIRLFVLAVTALFILSWSSALAQTKPAYDSVYCDKYDRGTTTGYSIYRVRDGKDIGNAVWLAGAEFECNEAAGLANALDTGIVCSRYNNPKSGRVSYSVYRISDGKDLGNAVIDDFYSCQAAVRSSRAGIFCARYHSEKTGTAWSMYSVLLGKDIGTQVYGTIEACEKAY